MATTTQTVQDFIQNLSAESSIYNNAAANNRRRIGQSFTTDAVASELVSIEVKLLDKPNWNGGKLALDLYELQGTKLVFMGSSEQKAYTLPAVNVRNFPAGIRLKPDTRYAFLCRHNNFFYLAASEGNKYTGGSAFLCDTPVTSDLNAVNYIPQNGIDLYFKITLKKDQPASNDSRTNPSELLAGQTLYTGTATQFTNHLISPNGKYHFYLQEDGSLSIWDYAATMPKRTWTNGTTGAASCTLVFQTDGNLVAYDNQHTAYWQTFTHPGTSPRYADADMKPVKLVMEDDGFVRLYSATGNKIWFEGA